MTALNGRQPADSFSSEEERRRRAAIEHGWEIVEELRALNADKSPETLLEEVTAEVEAVRQERYERRRGAKTSGR